MIRSAASRASRDFDLTRAVIDAFASAARRGCPPVECYKAAIAAYARRVPEATHAFHAREAVRIVLEARYLVLWSVGEA